MEIEAPEYGVYSFPDRVLYRQTQRMFVRNSRIGNKRTYFGGSVPTAAD